VWKDFPAGFPEEARKGLQGAAKRVAGAGRAELIKRLSSFHQAALSRCIFFHSSGLTLEVRRGLYLMLLLLGSLLNLLGEVDRLKWLLCLNRQLLFAQ